YVWRRRMFIKRHSGLTGVITNSSLCRSVLSILVILDRKLVKRKNRAAMKVLVQWKDQSEQDATWEFLDELQLRFPDFSELVSCGQEIDKNILINFPISIY
nr:hypothetical protein [Tanacetum cinerariifolium]